MVSASCPAASSTHEFMHVAQLVAIAAAVQITIQRNRALRAEGRLHALEVGLLKAHTRQDCSSRASNSVTVQSESRGSCCRGSQLNRSARGLFEDMDILAGESQSHVKRTLPVTRPVSLNTES